MEVKSIDTTSFKRIILPSYGLTKEKQATANKVINELNKDCRNGSNYVKEIEKLGYDIALYPAGEMHNNILQVDINRLPSRHLRVNTSVEDSTTIEMTDENFNAKLFMEKVSDYDDKRFFKEKALPFIGLAAVASIALIALLALKKAPIEQVDKTKRPVFENVVGFMKKPLNNPKAIDFPA